MEIETGGDADAPLAASENSAAALRAGRVAVGLSLADVAARTRIPLRHLEALERGDHASLPGPTYVTGFARAFARAVGLNDAALAAQVRAEMHESGQLVADPYRFDEPADPARVPPRFLAWIAAIIALLIAGGYALWRMRINTPPPTDMVSAPPPVAPAARSAAPPAPPPPASGPVVLTAVEDVWLRIYEPGGSALIEKTMMKGESFTVPATAQQPMILTGRPDALSVTVGGRAIPPLGTAERTIADVLLTPEALLARATAPALPIGGDMPTNATSNAAGVPTRR